MVWWTLSCVLAPLAVALWSTAPRAGGLPPATDTVLWSLGVAQPLLMMLLQWPAVATLVKRAWMWPLAGLATVVLTVLIQLGLYEVAFVVDPSTQSVVLPLLYLGVVAAVALALCQAAVMGLWRRGGGSWLVACFVALLGCRLLAWRLAVPALLSLLQPDLPHQTMVEAAVGAALSWGGFGALTGWLVWRRLGGVRSSVAMPA